MVTVWMALAGPSVWQNPHYGRHDIRASVYTGTEMNICIVGVGRMGRRHIASARAAGFAVEGIFDQSAEALATTLNDCGVEKAIAFTNAREMLQSVRPHAVVISTTAPSHHEFVCDAAATGVRYILCEKPMATSLAACDSMIAACREAGVKLAVNHQMRFMEQYSAIKELIDTPEFGGLRSMIVTSGNFGLAMNGSHYFEA